MVFGGVEEQVASLPECWKNWKAFMDSGNWFKVEVGDVENIFTAKGKLISADDDLPNITTRL